ncbi:putative methyltransferase NDAI_0B01450 [Naumovozyma dairenensis CBS 421]|uniref:Sugar phosphate phosphatase n=1 Tax=Naumovozyma dairenensis (strain ATCC 10597 / BCRC 20456 / CBS 421 / NBRC 0211 / NRRL Y-12639) TaxID=1071378 RepID=G0W5W8_NAUDC|nr:hypothetical protein NDAI_0B01450 [Naumovozyma dairenensis CBS 421]CCD23179.1 hypothetical protein NDAI_0B01450 [Naumovozyma dairenensis CBS 421]
MTTSIARRYKTNDKGTFGEYTASTRWPIIIQNSIDDITAELAKNSSQGDYKKQGEIIKQELIKYRQELLDHIPLRKFTQEECKIANVPLSFNEYLDSHKGVTWNNVEWLFSEIYLYRRINVMFQLQPLWKHFDIFNSLKQSTFKASLYGVIELALRYQSLITKFDSIANDNDKEILEILFKEFVEISLWGNATDLSLLTNATLDDIKSIQGAKAREESESKILINDTKKAWDTLIKLQGSNSRVDFILDNSGFELYADLMLASFLLHTKLANKIIFHAKDTPYMVSDVMLKDFDILLEDLKDRSFFNIDPNSNDSRALDLFADNIKKFNVEGAIEVRTDSFWTNNLDYWNLDPSETKYHGAELHKDLLNSNLVIFKGDLNYRKLTGDRKWAHTTSWDDAIGPLSSNGITLLSLRTIKADVLVGLPEGLNEELSELWEKDHPGHGSWWRSSGKWAVICYASS